MFLRVMSRRRLRRLIARAGRKVFAQRVQSFGFDSSCV
jgi:hypothetical protein